MRQRSSVGVAVVFVSSVGALLGAAQGAWAEVTPATTTAPSADARPPAVRYTPAPFAHPRSIELAQNERPSHVALDGFARAGAPQQVTARFAYDGHGLADEAVEVFAWRGTRWERLGEARTSSEHQRVALPDGTATDDKGTVVFRVPASHQLPPGVNRVRFVVRGDGSWADALLSVVDSTTRVVVSDVDGTLTSGESAEFLHQLGLAREPSANPGAADALRALVAQGYQVFYLTGRAGRSAVPQTRAWLSRHGFPAGVLQTRVHAGIFPDAGATTRYKTAALQSLSGMMGHPVDYGFGNTAIDVSAYRAAAIPASHRFFYRYTGETAGGVRHGDYRGLVRALGVGASVAVSPQRPTAAGSTSAPRNAS